jgi:hypothetical protein
VAGNPKKKKVSNKKNLGGETSEFILSIIRVKSKKCHKKPSNPKKPL